MYVDLSPGQTLTITVQTHLLGANLPLIQFAVDHPNLTFAIGAGLWAAFQYLLWRVEYYRPSFVAARGL